MNAPVNRRLANAMIAARAGWASPPRMGPGAAGELFMRRMQALISEKLAPRRLARYIEIRDAVRESVRRLKAGNRRSAGETLAACAARLPELADDSEVEDLARSWIDQAWAYLDARDGNHAAAAERLRLAMASDTRLERMHGYDLMHIGRINTVHLWLRVQAASGATDAALDCANAVVAYVNGFGDTLPLGEGWSRQAAARIPADLAAAMTWRVAGEAGVILDGMNRTRARRSLRRLPALEMLDAEVYGEISEWTRIKHAWAGGRADDFLTRVVPYLAAGRRETHLWYVVLLDLCRAALGLRPEAARLFNADVIERAREDSAMPRRLLRNFERLADDSPETHWIAPGLSRRFHLVCVGLPRSGVVSLYTLFRNFRAANEYAEADTIRMLLDHRRGRVSDGELRAWLVRRDAASALEMDAASFLHPVAGLLAEISAETRFVLPVREPCAWFESYIRELLRVYGRLRARGRSPPDWQREYGEMLVGHFDWREIATERARRASLPDVARRFLAHWAQATGKLLDVLPPERSIILRTEDLGPGRARLAAFAGQTPDSLTGDSHSNRSASAPNPLASLDEAWLRRTADEICGPTHARALRRCKV